MRRLVKSVLLVLLGTSVGLALAEAAFSLRDEGAFPHLNLYLEDSTLGVRLEPDAQMKLKVADNPVTTVRTNGLGFREPEWPALGKHEVLVVGDSQVFGLGVEAEDTFSAKLSGLLGAAVLNAGVPTYGPREYTRLVERALSQRRGSVKTVVYVLNLANDLFEVDRPNLQRHAVWDGWAVRSETAPKEPVAWFPFRRALMSRSHLVFAARQLLHTAAAGSASEGFATEGSWKDVVQAGQQVTPLPAEDEGAKQLLEARGAVGKELEELAHKLEAHLTDKATADERFAKGLEPLTPRGGDPRDILRVRYAEGARSIDLTAYHLLLSAMGEARHDERLSKLAAAGKDKELLALLEQRRALRAKLNALKPEGEPGHVLPIEQVLLETKRLCDAAGAKLVVVALPLDVMVSAKEWEKYAVPPLDMAPTRVLVEDLVARSRRLGALGVDPTAALEKAEPGAFLHGDLHLTPKGHAALAQAIADELAHPWEPKQQWALAEGRSWPPGPDEWRQAGECTVKGSTAAACETKLLREWLRVTCLTTGTDDEREARYPVFAEVLSGGHGDARAWAGNNGVTVLLPFVESDTASARFRWRVDADDRTFSEERVLRVEWKPGGERVMAFDAPERKPGSPERAPLGRKALDAVFEGECPQGQRHGGALRTCAPACDATTPCAKGHCESWPSGGFCAVP